MGDKHFYSQVSFQNPEQKPLEDVILTIRSEGLSRNVSALDKEWVEDRYFLLYQVPNLHDSEGKMVFGAKEHWLELVGYIIDDLDWLLQLPYYKFWSNVVFNQAILDTLVSFVQNAPPFYALDNFPDDTEMREALEKIRHHVLIAFARLVTNKESPTEYMSRPYQSNLLYKNYIITVPILLDLCQHYGRDNKKTVEKILNCAFTLQPLYKEDLEKSIHYLIQILRNTERRFEDCPVDLAGEAILLSERGGAKVDMTLEGLEEMVVHLLDTVSTISILLEIYPPLACQFRIENFITKLVTIYGNTIPEMYQKLDTLGFKDEIISKYVELKHRLDVTRIEIIELCRKVIYSSIIAIIESETPMTSLEITENVEEFFINITYAVTEKEFITDYHNLYPITIDIDTITSIYPEVDTMKCEYITSSLYAMLDSPPATTSTHKSNSVTSRSEVEPVAGASGLQNTQMPSKMENASDSAKCNKSQVEISSLITEVKDILCDLGEGFIEMCLKHYNYSSESVVNAILEDSLPPVLKQLDTSLPYIPPDPQEASAAVDLAIGMQRLNVFDNDEFDVMTKDVIDRSRIHKGKRKDKFRNVNDLLNDKSHIKEIAPVYSKYTLVDDYDDEYDDTYDGHDIGSNAQDDVIEMDARPFTIPRVLYKPDKNIEEEEEEEEVVNNHNFTTTQNRNNFCQDPALLRAKAEERRMSKHGRTGQPQRNVEGNPKGQGQSKDVANSRNKKNVQKSARANHNRRAGSEWKRKGGMVPT